jgi:hypothetical protein
MYLEIFWQHFEVILLVEVFRIKNRSHPQNLQVTFQFISQLCGWHVEPLASFRTFPFFL